MMYGMDILHDIYEALNDIDGEKIRDIEVELFDGHESVYKTNLVAALNLIANGSEKEPRNWMRANRAEVRIAR